MKKYVCLLLVFCLSGCAPNVNSSDPKERLRAIKSLEDSSMLADIALNDKSEEVRDAAILKVNDLNVLAQIIVLDKSDFIHQATINRFVQIQGLQEPSQPGIKRVVDHSSEDSIRELANVLNAKMVLKNINDPNELAKIALNSNDIMIVESALLRISDQNILASLVGSFGYHGNNIYAFWQITDDNIKANIIINASKDSKIHSELLRSLERIHDQKLLAKIASESKSRALRLQAIRYLKDPSVANEIILHDPDRSIRLDYVRELSDNQKECQDLLYAIALSTADPELRKFVISKHLADIALLTKLSVQDKNEAVRGEALKELKYQESLHKKITEETPRSVRHIPIRFLGDMYLLEKIAVENENLQVRMTAVERLKDKTLLADLSTRDKAWEIRKIAVGKIYDQNVLTKIAFDDKSPNVRAEALKNLQDQSILSKIAAEDADEAVRREALNKVSDPIVHQTLLVKSILNGESPDLSIQAVERIEDKHILFKVALKDKPSNAGVRAVRMIEDQGLLKEIALKSKYFPVTIEALSQIKDQFFIEKMFYDNKSQEVRNYAIGQLNGLKPLLKIIFSEKGKIDKNIALMKIGNPEILVAFSTGMKDPLLRETSILLLNDQEALKSMAENNPSAANRKLSLYGIQDEDFLVSRVNNDTSAIVRGTALILINDRKKTQSLAINCFYDFVRRDALYLLGDSAEAAVVKENNESINNFTEQLRQESNPSILMEQALNAKFDVWRLAAVENLNDPASLVKVAIESVFLDVLRIVLAKLDDKENLLKVANTAKVNSMRFAAEQKSGKRSWSDIFNANYDHPRDLGEALEAVILFDEIQIEAKEGIQQASLSMIRRGDESRIEEMVVILSSYGDKTLAEDFYNCGQPDLKKAAGAWASANGFIFQQDFTSGSARAGWGSHSNQ
ncbi:MAG: hypothetical protein KKF30_00910 [Proteobacteria bacterium]|nr:hypothetical protein [Pseudomonadota bacterium]MBU4470815.1 hypothetical protein [Pseudomonadota bacterium]MCG2751457.1 hypothetical protein [Desulfobacteraceae bacterium]